MNKNLSNDSATHDVRFFTLVVVAAFSLVNFISSLAVATESLRGFVHFMPATTTVAAPSTSAAPSGLPSAPSTSNASLISSLNPSAEVTLVLKSSTQPYKITSSRASLLNNLKSLREGDFIIATGNIDSHAHVVDLDAVESVGLQALLGIWRTEQWQFFEFRDFNRLNLYSSTQSPPSPLGLEKLREFSYLLAPDEQNKFSILLSDDKSVHVGSLEFTDDSKVHIQLFDSNTGAVAQDISLSPLPIN